MKTTLDYLDDLKAKLGVTSDYAIAAKLGLTRSAVSRYRNGLSAFDEGIAAQVAELLEVEPIEIIAAAKWERCADPKLKRVWERAWWTAYAGPDFNVGREFTLCKIGLRFPAPATTHRAA